MHNCALNNILSEKKHYSRFFFTVFCIIGVHKFSVLLECIIPSNLAVFSFPAAVVRRQSRLTTDDAVGASDEPLEVARGMTTTVCDATKLAAGVGRVSRR